MRTRVAMPVERPVNLRTRLRILWRRLTRQDYFFVGDEEVETGPGSDIDRTVQHILDQWDAGYRPGTDPERFFGASRTDGTGGRQ